MLLCSATLQDTPHLASRTQVQHTTSTGSMLASSHHQPSALPGPALCGKLLSSPWQRTPAANDNTLAMVLCVVPDLHACSLVLNVDVDREMGIHQAHLILEALGHTLDQVGHVAAGSADGGKLLLLAKVAVNLAKAEEGKRRGRQRQHKADGGVAAPESQ